MIKMMLPYICAPVDMEEKFVVKKQLKTRRTIKSCWNEAKDTVTEVQEKNSPFSFSQHRKCHKKTY